MENTLYPASRVQEYYIRTEGVRNLTVDLFTARSMRLFQMLGFFLRTGIAMKVISAYISILRTCQVFFSNPLKLGNTKLWHTFKRIAHTALATLFKSMH